MITFPEVVDYLRDHRYLLILKGKYSLSGEFQQAMKELKRGAVLRIDVEAIPDISSDKLMNVYEGMGITLGDTDWQTRYINFIGEAKVPVFLENSKLDRYSVNKYSEDGMRAFRKALQSGIDYSLLVKSTMLYYKSATKFKKTIGNYMAHGDWLTDYNALREVAMQGEQQVKDHIKTQITNDRERDPFD